MPLTTYTLTATILDASGAGLAGVVLTAQLDKADEDTGTGIVVPATAFSATTDANGVATLDLWSNTAGSTGSVYRFVATYAGATLFNTTGTMPASAANLRDLIDVAAALPMQPYPAADFEREGRIVDDLVELMHGPDTEAHRTRVKRWIWHVLNHAKRGRAWWFLENLARRELSAGQDVIDLVGHFDRVKAVFAPKRLNQVALSELVAKREEYAKRNWANGGEPKVYALEAGRRLHLWPAPAGATPFAVLYLRPMLLPTLPDEWETILLDGVIGRYGRHFDRDALVEEPASFERRYLMALREAGSDSHDALVHDRWGLPTPDGGTVAADSRYDTPTAFTAPASVDGIGYVSVETGPYLFQVA